MGIGIGIGMGIGMGTAMVAAAVVVNVMVVAGICSTYLEVQEPLRRFHQSSIPLHIKRLRRVISSISFNGIKVAITIIRGT